MLLSNLSQIYSPSKEENKNQHFHLVINSSRFMKFRRTRRVDVKIIDVLKIIQKINDVFVVFRKLNG